MSIVLLVYLASVVNSLTAVATAYAISSIVVICIVKIAKIIHACDNMEPETPFRHIKKWIASVVIAALLAILLPSERVIYVMAGASVAQDIVNSPKTTAVMDRVCKIIEKKLDEQLMEKVVDKAVDVTASKAKELTDSNKKGK